MNGPDPNPDPCLCPLCGNTCTKGFWHIDVKNGVSGRWYRLTVDRRAYVEGLWAGLTDYSRCGDEMALVDGEGRTVRRNGGGGLQVGMKTVPYPFRFAWAPKLPEEITALGLNPETADILVRIRAELREDVRGMARAAEDLPHLRRMLDTAWRDDAPVDPA